MLLGKKINVFIYLNEELAIAHNCIGVEKHFVLVNPLQRVTGFTC